MRLATMGVKKSQSTARGANSEDAGNQWEGSGGENRSSGVLERRNQGGGNTPAKTQVLEPRRGRDSKQNEPIKIPNR